MQIAKLLLRGTPRVLYGKAGMTFIIERSNVGGVAHVRDYRFPCGERPYTIWSIAADGYELIEDTHL